MLTQWEAFPFILVKIGLEKAYDKISWNVVINRLDSLNASLAGFTHASPPLPLNAYSMGSLPIGLRAVEVSNKGTKYHLCHCFLAIILSLELGL